MAKRTPKTSRIESPQPAAEPEPAWRAEGHSGEGSASAMATLQDMEQRRVVARPADPPSSDEAGD